MNTMLIVDNPVIIQLITDRFIVFLAAFVMLLVGAFTRNSTMDKTSSFREMIIMSLFFALVLTFEANRIMKKMGYSIFFIALLLGLVEKETLQLVKKYVLYRLKNMLSTRDKSPPQDKTKDK